VRGVVSSRRKWTRASLGALALASVLFSGAGAADGSIALRIRDRPPGGAWAGAQTVWRAAVHSRYIATSLDVATDAAGDEALAWLLRKETRPYSNAWTVMVATRAAGGAFTQRLRSPGTRATCPPRSP